MVTGDAELNMRQFFPISFSSHHKGGEPLPSILNTYCSIVFHFPLRLPFHVVLLQSNSPGAAVRVVGSGWYLFCKPNQSVPSYQHCYIVYLLRGKRWSDP